MPKGGSRIEKNRQGKIEPNVVRKVTIPFNNVVSITDPGAANAGATSVICGLPQGHYLILGAVLDLTMTALTGGLTATFSGNIAVGSTATADANLTAPTTDNDIVQSQAFTTAAASVSARTRYTSNAGSLTTLVDNQNGAKAVNLNMFIADAAISSNATLRAQGVLHLVYAHLGDDTQ